MGESRESVVERLLPKTHGLLNEGVGAIYGEFVVGKEEGDKLFAEQADAIEELEALLAVVEAAQAVAEFEQTYSKHDDNSSDDGPPTCTICGEWGDRIYALDDALAALTSEQKPEKP
jgi:hypothetical protein